MRCKAAYHDYGDKDKDHHLMKNRSVTKCTLYTKLREYGTAHVIHKNFDFSLMASLIPNIIILFLCCSNFYSN